jgi:putative endonuclease
MLVFVEVKSRATREQALEAITPGFRRRLEQAARIWVSPRHKLQNHLWRFDLVLLAPGRFPRHMKDAWRAEN